MRLDGKTALITGGGSGIGRATALLFAERGANVVLVGRRAAPLEETVAEIERHGGNAIAHPADLCDDHGIRRAVDRTVEVFGALDILVNNAGFAPQWTPIHETPDDVWDQVFETNLKGVFRMSRAAIPHLVPRRGAIVNVASISALKAKHSVASYSAAKAGLIAFTRCVAAEYGWQGVRCNCIIPSWVEPPMTRIFLEDDAARDDIARRHALRRIATPEEIARAILYLASDDAAFVTGVAHPVDGGMSAL